MHTSNMAWPPCPAPVPRPCLYPCANITCTSAPAGHNAKRDLGTAGSYYNNAAVAVRAAQAAGAERVLLLDWDVHHCAGTQAIFQEDPLVLVVSLHWFEQ